MAKEKGLFVTFEGNECSGKSTQINLVADRLVKEGFTVRKVREPGGTDVGEEIRKIVKTVRTRPLSSESELCLFQAARAQLVEDVIRPAIRGGEIVLCDRFSDSTWVYQGWVGGINLLSVEMLTRLATGNLQIDLTFLLALPVTELVARMQNRGAEVKEDSFDSRGLQYFKRVNEGYDQLAKNAGERLVKIDATLDQQTIADLIVKKIVEKAK